MCSTFKDIRPMILKIFLRYDLFIYKSSKKLYNMNAFKRPAQNGSKMMGALNTVKKVK